MNDKMKNLIIRTASGLVMLAVLLGATLHSFESFALLGLLILVGGMWEFYKLAQDEQVTPLRYMGLTMGILLFGFFYLWLNPESHQEAIGSRMLILLAAILLLAFLTFIVELFGKGGNLVANVGTTLLGVLYVALPTSLLLSFPFLATGGWDPRALLGFIFIIWSNDVFAYLTGITIGRHKMCPTISPKKSWEGFVGGVIGAVAMGYATSVVLEADTLMWCGLALVAAITGVVGDLTESQLKRKAGVKDSGNIIPGHGGVLDRFDALILATPFVCVFILFVKLFS